MYETWRHYHLNYLNGQTCVFNKRIGIEVSDVDRLFKTISPLVVPTATLVSFQLNVTQLIPSDGPYIKNLQLQCEMIKILRCAIIISYLYFLFDCPCLKVPNIYNFITSSSH